MSHPVNKSEHKLERYGIPAPEGIHSLIHALRQLGIVTSSVEVLVNGGQMVNAANRVPRRRLTKIAEKITKNIKLVYIGKNGQIVYNNYPNKKLYADTIRLGYQNGHYFIHEAIRHLHQSPPSTRIIYTLTQSNSIVWQRPMTSSLTAKLVIPLKDIMQEQAPIKVKTLHKKPAFTISYADVECVTQPRHVPLMYGRYCEGKFYLTSNGYDEDLSSFKQFLEQFPNGNHVVYFHNLKYDWNIIKNTPNIRIISMLKSEGIYYSVTFNLYKKHFEFRDSYKYIPRKLADFSAMFQIPAKMDCILYELYTKENTTAIDYVTCRDLKVEDVPELVYHVTETGVTKYFEPITDVSNYIYLDERVALERSFIKLAERYFYNGKYYHLAHFELYLQRDCELLSKGMEAYKDRIENLLGMDCHSKLTLPSLVHDRMCSVGCYDGIFQLSDNLRRFVSQSVHGGRVATRDNKKWDVTGEHKVLDGRSLYPSAIHRICNPTPEDNRQAGFPCGSAKYIEDWDECNTFFHYVVRIRLLAIKKYQQIPFVTYYADETRTYTNEIVEGQEEVVVDKITLEDWVKYQHIEYEFIEGVYWNAGGNTSAGAFVASLYNARREYANAGNESMSQVCKLALNSLFGKTILKPRTTKTVVKSKAKGDAYMDEHFEEIRDMEKCGEQYVFSVTVDDIDHANLCHVGGLILSMARRIMNEVMALANELQIPVFYTDTDSMHVLSRRRTTDKEDNVTILADEYKSLYGRTLLGSNLGQFALELKYPDHTNIYSERVIILGKKAYLHVVKGTNDQDESEAYNYCRMKGINSHAISEYKDEVNLYERLYSGETIEFDLAYGNAVSFQIGSNVITREKFSRRIRFNGAAGVF